MKNRNLTFLVLALLVSGCATADWTHYTKKEAIVPEESRGTAIIMDAKQRVMVTAARQFEQGSGNDKIVKKYLNVCAEPSPDALSALSASQGASASKGELNAAVNLALSESAGSIGLRTQTIQLMRDSMYRLCEGYLSGALSDLAFETLHRRFQSSMVAILAIEQLTGVARSPNVTLDGNSIAGSAGQVSKYTELTIKSRNALETATTAVEKATADHANAKENAGKPENTFTSDDQAALDAYQAQGDSVSDGNKVKKAVLESRKANAKTASDEVAAAKKILDDASAIRKLREDELNANEAARVAATSGGGTASSRAAIVVPDEKPDAETVKHVAQTIESITEQTIGKGFSNELCTSVLLHNTKTTAKLNRAATGQSVVDICAQYLQSTAGFVTNYTRTQEKLVDCLDNNPDQPGKCKVLMDYLANTQSDVTDMVAGFPDSGPSPWGTDLTTGSYLLFDPSRIRANRPDPSQDTRPLARQ